MTRLGDDALVYEFTQHYWWNETIRNYLRLKKDEIKIILDVGANIGSATRLFLEELNPSIIYAFEPDGENFIYLSAIDDKRVKLYNYGIYYGATTSTVTGVKAFGHVGYSCDQVLSPEHKFPSAEAYPEKQFELREIEEFVNKADLVKLDCEGAEFNIIENSFVVKNAKFLLVEFHNHDPEYDFKFVQTYFPNHKIISEYWCSPYLLLILELHE